MGYVGSPFDTEVRARLNPRRWQGAPPETMPGPMIDDPAGVSPVAAPGPLANVTTKGGGDTPPWPSPLPEQPKTPPGETPPWPSPPTGAQPKGTGQTPPFPPVATTNDPVRDAVLQRLQGPMTAAPGPTTNVYDGEAPSPDPTPGTPGTGNPDPAPPPPAPPQTPGAMAWDAADHRGSFQRLTAGKPPSSATLIAMKPELEAAGWTLEPPNAMGIVSKMRNKATGEVVRVGGHFDSAPSEGFPMTWEWVGQGNGAGGGGGADPLPDQPGQSDFQKQLRALLMQRMQADGQPFDVNGAEVTAPMDAARLETDRAHEQLRKDLAERAYASGSLNTQEIDRGVQQSRERGASTLATIRGKAVMQGVAAQQARLQEDLQMALASGDAEQARQIQLYMANLDAILRREGYRNQRDIVEAGINNGAGR